MKLRSIPWVATITVCVLVLTLLIYWPGLSGPFVLDDLQNIVRPYVADPDLTAILYNITHNNSGIFGRSVSILSFIVTEMQFGNEAWGYKFHNLLLHLGCGLLLFRLLYLILPLLEQRERLPRDVVVAGVVCSFWLLHPLLVSTVLYAVQRMTQLGALFSLLALLAYVDARLTVRATFRYWLCGWVLFPLSLLLALLSKETGILIPVYILVFEVLVFRVSLPRLRQSPHVLWWLVVFVGLPLLLGSLYVFTHFGELTDYSGRTFTLPERLLTQIHAVFFYARLILLPRVRAMGLFHDDFPVAMAPDLTTVLLMGVLLLVLALAWYLRRRLPVLAFGLCWFFASHLLESTFLPLELVFEHRNYLAALGLLLPPLYYLIQTTELAKLRWVTALFFLVLLLQTGSRVQEWSNEGVLLTVAVGDHPASPRARTTLANYLFEHEQMEAGVTQLQAVQELSPDNAGPFLHELVIACGSGERNAELLEQSASRLRSFPVSVYTLNSMENLLTAIGQKKCTAVTHEDLDNLINAGLAQPGIEANPENYGYLKRFAGIHALQKGQYAQGVIALREAQEYTGYVTILRELIRYQIALERLDDAADTLAYLEQLNAESFGIETYLVEQMKAELDVARTKASVTAEE